MRIGMWQKAERELRRSLGYRPENHAAQFNLGLCHLKKGQITMARRFFEKAIDLRPEPLYCEALAQLDARLGTGAEFTRFLVPCAHECDHGYAFARAGLWKKADSRFASALADEPNATTWLNRAVASEVMGRRSMAKRYLSNARRLTGKKEYDQFATYLDNAPDFPLEMLVVLPELTTATDSAPVSSMFVNRSSTVIRLNSSHQSVGLGVLDKNASVDVLETTEGWIRVRTKTHKEGYIPAFLLSETLVPDVPDAAGNSYSQPYVEAEPEIIETDTEMPQEPTPEPVFTVNVLADGSAVAVRTETSLMAEIVGYVDPGRKLRVQRSGNEKWLEIVSGRIRGFILKSYVEMPDGD